MPQEWINPEDYTYNTFLLLERFQIALLFEHNGWGKDKESWRRNMGIALNAHPAVKWYFQNRCPQYAAKIEEIAASAPAGDVRQAEIYIINSMADWVIYTTPEKMAKASPYIAGWNSQRLHDIVDLAGKTVLDIGAGSGRLTFAAAEKATWVYAVEPVETLRNFVKEEAARRDMKNIRVSEGFVANLPFPDNTFDAVIFGHIIGDDLEAECAEIARVCKQGGWMVDCPGDDKFDYRPMQALVQQGWEAIHYTGSFGKDVYCHRKQNK